jgi:murein DD-endopeptidase MepM/ murein hydrolase activator NlpD
LPADNAATLPADNAAEVQIILGTSVYAFASLLQDTKTHKLYDEELAKKYPDIMKIIQRNMERARREVCRGDRGPVAEIGGRRRRLQRISIFGKVIIGPSHRWRHQHNRADSGGQSQVIAGFGPRPDGQRNDGINIAVPENTPIKAADDGVVAYSGNDLKSFGNLVLVRHANDYVTVYAHAKELRVKAGDQIKGGDLIGLSGQTGNVDTPQIHFEIRKGSTPVDPMQLLHGG